ncbi:MAG: putative Ig domain-containing protein [Syntrophobacterales bacterium]|nr:putative Ig domain-containing protein [Syntrophobacterales bacterium]
MSGEGSKFGCRFYGFTLIEIAIALVIVGILIGSGVSLVAFLTKRAKFSENKERLKEAYESVLAYAVQRNTLPSSIADAGGPSRDVYGNEFLYVSVANWVGKDICTTDPLMLLTVNNISEGVSSSEVAFIIISRGENYCNQTGLNSPFSIYPRGASGNCCSPHPPVPPCPASNEYDDLVIYIDKGKLRQRVCDAFKIVTEVLPTGEEYKEYPRVTFEAANGTPLYTWSISSGRLPNGIELTPSGVISGSPTESGTFPFTVQVKDAEGRVATKGFSITVESNKPRITTEFLPIGYVGEPYPYAQLSATGGSGGYSFSGVLPQDLGLSIDADGKIGGIPTREGTYSVLFTVIDSSGNKSHKTLSVTIYPARSGGLILSPPSGTSWSATIGQSFSAVISVSGGAPPYSNTQCSPSACAGLTLSCSSDRGTISGTYTGGSCTFSIGWKDSLQQNAIGTYYVNQSCLPLAITPSSGTSWNATVGQSFSQTINISGGKPPLYNTQCGPLGGTCSGLNLSCTANSGVISGTPTASGSCTANVAWRDSCSPNQQTISGTYTINISQPCPSMTLDPTSGTVFLAYDGEFFSKNITVLGGYGTRFNTFCSLVCSKSVEGLTANCTGDGATISGKPYSLKTGEPQECNFNATWVDSCPSGKQSIGGNYKINVISPQLAVVPESSIYYKKNNDASCYQAAPRSCIVVSSGEVISFYQNLNMCTRGLYACQIDYMGLTQYDFNKDGNIGLQILQGSCYFNDSPSALCM